MSTKERGGSRWRLPRRSFGSAAKASTSLAYKAGAATNLEFIQAQQVLRGAEVTFILSRARWELAHVELRLASGLPPSG